MGFVWNKKINENFILRLSSELDISESNIKYEMKTYYNIVRVSKVLISFPYHLIYTKKYSKYYPYCLIGLSPKINLSTNSKEFVIKEKAVDLSFDYGIGFKKNVGKFYIGIELINKNGILNTKKADSEFKNSLIGGMKNNNLGINLILSGLFVDK